MANLVGGIALALTSLFWDQGYLSGDPKGQQACYRLDFARERTIGAIRSGKAEVVIDGTATTSSEQPAYEVTFRAEFAILFLGLDRAGFQLRVPDEYFTAKFMSGLSSSATHLFSADDFKMMWLGRDSVTTLGGKTYANAEHIRIFDIDTSRQVDFSDAVDALAYDQAIKDLVIDAYIHPSAPGLGAVKLNMTGNRHGVKLWAGLDYDLGSVNCLTHTDGG